MVKLLNKKMMVASIEQSKSKKKRAARVRIQTLQTKILDLQAGMVTPPSKDDGEYYHQNWQSTVEDTEVKIEETLTTMPRDRRQNGC